MSFEDQNSFWLKNNLLFAPNSNLKDLIQFVTGNSQIVQDPWYMCSECNSDHLVEDDAHNDVICTVCGFIQPYPPIFIYGEITNGYQYNTKKCYTRKDHLECILVELQCGRSRDMYQIVQDIQEKLDQLHLPVTFTNVQKNLRKLGYYQHYLHIPSILNMLCPTKFKPWNPSKNIINNLLGLFCQYEERFERYKIQNNVTRKNSLNYHFILIKLFQFVNEKDIPYRFLSIPKGKKTILEHEEIWSSISTRLVCHMNTSTCFELSPQ